MHRRVHSHIVFYSLSSVALGAFLVLFSAWSATAAEIDNSVSSLIFNPFNVSTAASVIPRIKPNKQTVKGVYLTAYSANNPKKIDEIIKLLDTTELNAVVIDIKDYTGKVLYASKVPETIRYKTRNVLIKNIPELIKKLHEHNIYVIARQTVFQDPALAEANHSWALENKNGGLWRDHKGLAWVDAAKEEVWEYNVAIAKEVIDLGFDEVNFDYVRFPSDGNMATIKYSQGDKKKYEVMSDFYHYLSDELFNEPAYISLDMFGFVMEKKGTDDMNIGQRLADAVDAADYICPMMYPSHYPPGHLGLQNPAAYPALVFEHGMQLGMPKFEDTRAEVRPWIQAFNMGAMYGATNIRAQIDVVEKYSNAGWLMWNASNRYTAAGLKSDVQPVAFATST